MPHQVHENQLRPRVIELAVGSQPEKLGMRHQSQNPVLLLEVPLQLASKEVIFENKHSQVGSKGNSGVVDVFTQLLGEDIVTQAIQGSVEKAGIDSQIILEGHLRRRSSWWTCCDPLNQENDVIFILPTQTQDVVHFEFVVAVKLPWALPSPEVPLIGLPELDWQPGERPQIDHIFRSLLFFTSLDGFRFSRGSAVEVVVKFGLLWLKDDHIDFLIHLPIEDTLLTPLGDLHVLLLLPSRARICHLLPSRLEVLAQGRGLPNQRSLQDRVSIFCDAQTPQGIPRESCRGRVKNLSPVDHLLVDAVYWYFPSRFCKSLEFILCVQSCTPNQIRTALRQSFCLFHSSPKPLPFIDSIFARMMVSIFSWRRILSQSVISKVSSSSQMMRSPQEMVPTWLKKQFVKENLKSARTYRGINVQAIRLLKPGMLRFCSTETIFQLASPLGNLSITLQSRNCSSFCSSPT